MNSNISRRFLISSVAALLIYSSVLSPMFSRWCRHQHLLMTCLKCIFGSLSLLTYVLRYYVHRRCCVQSSNGRWSYRRTWLYNIRRNIAETGWAVVDWTDRVQDKNSSGLRAVVNIVLKGRFA